MMPFHRMIGLAVALGLVGGLVGCSKEKEEALAELDKIEAACKDKKEDEAGKLALALRDKNAKFKAAFDGATDTVKDKTKVNFCGALVLTETRLRLEN